MSALSTYVEDYLRLRRALGYKLERAGLVLPQFVAYLVAARSGSHVIEVAIEPGRVSVAAAASDVGDVNDYVECETWGPSSASVNLNGRFLLEALEHWPTEKTRITLSTSHDTPGLFESGDAYIYSALAIRVA